MAWEWTIDIESFLGPRRIERCLRITEAAIKCFAERGFAETSVGLITETAGVQRTQFYFFYENKTDCFTACHRICIAEVESRIQAASADAYSWQDKIRSGVKATLNLFSSNPFLARLVLFEAELVGTEADKKIRQAAYERLALELTSVFEKAAPPDVEVAPLMAATAIGSVRAVLMDALESLEPDQLQSITSDVIIAIMAVCVGPREARELAGGTALI